MTRFGASGRLLNAIACLEQSLPNRKGVTRLFEEAAKLGSGYAWVNLALRHLKAGRLNLALPAIEQSLKLDSFSKDPERRAPAQELLVTFLRH